MPHITTPEDVLKFKGPTKEYLCAPEDNIYGIVFIEFEIFNDDTKEKYFQIGCPDQRYDLPSRFSRSADDLRKIYYELPIAVLEAPVIGTRLKFSVGNEELKNFRMIERHYFRNTLLKSYDFNFNFCIPNSINEWSSYYRVPPLDSSLIDEIVKHPNETQSDSFYFVEDELVMHNKAIYTYFRPASPVNSPTRRKNYPEVKESEHYIESKEDLCHARK